MRATRAFAPAKINLFLHVGAVRQDGYHPLTSWMVFADVGDTLELAPAPAMELHVTGPFANGLPSDGDNIIVRARDGVLAAAGGDVPPFRLALDKQLPLASGMGGGSSDAAATLRLVGAAAGVPQATLRKIAADLGSDVPACLHGRSVMASGRGEVLSAAPASPPLPAVLVNPLVAVSTREVFAAFDACLPGDISGGAPPSSFSDAGEVAAFLTRQRNDLAAPATAVQPAIGEILAVLSAAPETLIARVSGSGATAFGLCRTTDEASALAARVAAEHPGWWVRKALLG